DDPSFPAPIYASLVKVGTEAAFFRQLLERLELIRGMHVFPGDILVQADFVRIVRGVHDAPDRFGFLDLLALHPQKLGKPSAFADGHEIEPRGAPLSIDLRLNDEILQNA